MGICSLGQFLKVLLTTIDFVVFQNQGRGYEVTCWDAEIIARRKRKQRKWLFWQVSLVLV